MSRIGRRRNLWGLAVAALAGIALLYATAIPSSAAPGGKKYYSFTVTPPGVLAGAQGVPFQVTITNTSPSGSSSNISSVSITVPSQFTIVGTPTLDASSTHTNSNATIGCNNPTAQQINICSLDPIKRLEQVVVDFNANVITPAPASGVSGPWAVEANTGTQLNGQDFDPNPSQGTVTTTIFDAQLCNGQSYTEGNLTLTSNDNTCFTFSVTSSPGQFDITKSGNPLVTGTVDITWDVSAGPVPWTQVSWPGVTLHDIQLCNTGTYDNNPNGLNNWASQFPTIAGNTSPEQVCLVSSDLHQVGNTWVQSEEYAVNTDLTFRKSL